MPSPHTYSRWIRPMVELQPSIATIFVPWAIARRDRTETQRRGNLTTKNNHLNALQTPVRIDERTRRQVLMVWNESELFFFDACDAL